MAVEMKDIKKRRRMCSNKSRFERRIDAVIFLLKKGITMRIYLCPHCGGFHLTKRPSADFK